jgi:hypothetical protein
MSEVSTFRCDECGKLKSDELQLPKQWYRAVRISKAQLEGAPNPGPRFIIMTWEDGVLDRLSNPKDYTATPGDKLHLCGMGCAVKAMTKAMEQSG